MPSLFHCVLTIAFAAVVGVPLSAHADVASQDDVASVVARFDRAVVSGLPFTVSVPAVPRGESGRTRRAVDTDIVVERRLPVDLSLAPSIPGTMYAGRLYGSRAVFTRAADRLDISLPSEDGVRVVGFRSGRATVERRVYAASDGYVDEPKVAANTTPSIGPDHIEDPLAYHPTFHIFMHNDLGNQDSADLHSRFTAWWIDDLLKLLIGEEKIVVRYYMRVPWISDMDYERDDVIDRFADALGRIAPHLGLPYGTSYKHKFLLLTARPALGEASGLAVQGQSEAVATVMGRLSVVAHEFGHTMGASHEAAVTTWIQSSTWSLIPWHWCDSNMHPVAPSAFSCLKYSAENERAIRSYQRHGPTTERADLWLERR